jgi:hypothetical protein
VLRSRPPGELFVDLVAAEPVEVAAASAVTVTVTDVPAAAAPPMPPPMPPAYYAGEAKRLLERARALRATVPEPGPIGS